MSMKEGSQKVCVHLRGDDDKVDPKSRIPLRGRVQKIGAPFLKMSLTRGTVQFVEAVGSSWAERKGNGGEIADLKVSDLGSLN